MLVVGLAMSAYAQSHANQLSGWVVAWLGPPMGAMEETHASHQDTSAFDHSRWDVLLKAHVDAQGWVDYQGFAQDREALDAYLAALGQADFESLGRDEKLALLLNAYNAFTVALILDHDAHGKLKSIKDIASSQRWDAKRWLLAGKTVSLNELEHQWVRNHFKEPRIHWALVCAAYSCPPLLNTAYTGKQLDQQLAQQETRVLGGDRWLRHDPQGNILHLTALLQWYGSDFKAATGQSVVDYVAARVPAIKGKPQPKVEWIHYEWKLNSQANRP